MSKRYHRYQTSVWRGGGIHEQKLTYNIKLQFGGVGVGVGVHTSKSYHICHATGIEEDPKVTQDIQCLW